MLVIISPHAGYVCVRSVDKLDDAIASGLPGRYEIEKVTVDPLTSERAIPDARVSVLGATMGRSWSSLTHALSRDWRDIAACWPVLRSELSPLVTPDKESVNGWVCRLPFSRRAVAG